LAAIPTLADLTKSKHWQKLQKSRSNTSVVEPFIQNQVLVNFLSKKEINVGTR
jgi:hypothetical protein